MVHSTKKDKITVAQRRINVGIMIAKGAKEVEIMQHFNISRRTFYRDMEYVRALNRGTLASDFACTRMVEMQDELLRNMLIVMKKAQDEDTYLKAAGIARKLLSDLERTYERVGLIPSPKHTAKVRDDSGALKLIKEEALKALNLKDRSDF